MPSLSENRGIGTVWEVIIAARSPEYTGFQKYPNGEIQNTIMSKKAFVEGHEFKSGFSMKSQFNTIFGPFTACNHVRNKLLSK